MDPSQREARVAILRSMRNKERQLREGGPPRNEARLNCAAAASGAPGSISANNLK